MKKKIYLPLLALVILALIFSGFYSDLVFAAGKAVTELSNPLDNAGKSITFTEVSARFIKLAFAVISFSSLLMFIYGGFKYMTAENSKDTDSSKKIMYTSAIGVAIAFSAYSIITTVFKVIIF